MSSQNYNQTYGKTYLEYKELCENGAKNFLERNEASIIKLHKNVFDNLLIKKVFEDNIEYWEMLFFVYKSWIELNEIWWGIQIFGLLYDKFRWRIVDHTFCIVFGAVVKCNLGIYFSFICTMLVMYSFHMSIFSQFIELPSSMIIGQLELNAIRYGIWKSTTSSLWDYFDTKIMDMYAPGKHRPFDRSEKLSHYDWIIGDDVRHMWNLFERVVWCVKRNFKVRLIENIFIKTIKLNKEKRNSEINH